MVVKQLGSFMVLNIDGGNRVTYTFDEINTDTGDPVSVNTKKNFYAVDPELVAHIEAIMDYIRINKLGG